MKKFIKLICITALTLGLVACSNGNSEPTEDNIISISATLNPHANILEFAKPLLKEKGYDLEITVLDDYQVFNRALDSGDVLVNYFQHIPFFDQQIQDNGYDIVNVGGVHIEPFGFYSNTISNTSELKENDTIIISNSVADHGRTLAILEKAGVIELDPSVNKQVALTSDITSNPLNLEFIEVKAELLYNALENNEGALVAINGNYALANGLKPLEQAIILEEGSADNPYINIVATKTENKDNPKVIALMEVLKSEKVKQFITDTYKGSVISAE